MRRRDFIVLSGAAAAWPLAARAQPAAMRRVAVIMSPAEESPEGRARIAAFRDGLEQAGWREGRNLALDIRWAAGDMARIRAHAAELVAAAPEAIVANGTPAVIALQKLTRSIPIIFAQIQDPVGLGFAASLARPGGNITGFAMTADFDLIGKWLEMLREAAPGTKRGLLLFNPDTVPFFRTVLGAHAPGAPAFAIPLVPGEVRTPDEIGPVLADFARAPGGGLIVPLDSFIVANLREIAAHALQKRLPSVSVYRQFTVEGGLASYGPDILEIFRRSAGYVDRVLKGEKPADLPVQAPTRFEAAVNLKTAHALGITVPPTLLATADEVIE
jgi:putative ABC transport system substrate-binding protein